LIVGSQGKDTQVSKGSLKMFLCYAEVCRNIAEIRGRSQVSILWKLNS